MNRLARLLAGLALVVALVPSASAQYYYQPAPRYHPGPQYYPQPYPGPQYHEDYRPRRHVQRQYSPYRGDVGRICMTGRGPCGIARYQPIGSSCRCQIDGLKKGGYIAY